MYQRTIVKFLIVCLALALHKVFFEEIWLNSLASQGLSAGLGEVMLGYVIILAPAWMIAWYITRPMKRVQVSK